MKTIPLARAITHIQNATALLIDDESVVLGQILDENDGDGDLFLRFETQYGEETFAKADNQRVRIDTSGCLVLLNTKGHTAHLMILNAAPVEAI